MRKFLVLASLLIAFSPKLFAANPAVSSSVVLTATPATAAYGSLSTLVAAVQDQRGNPVTSGAVTFYDGASVLGTVQVVRTALGGGGVGTAMLKTILVPLGSNNITAAYSGGGGASRISAPAVVTVTGRYPAITTLAASGSAGDYALTSTVLGAGPIAPTGGVVFADSTTGLEIGAEPLNQAELAQTFTAAPAATGVMAPLAEALADLNGDGIPDLVTVSADGLFVQLGNGDGIFKAPIEVSDTNISPENYFSLLPGAGIVFGDFNGDGNPDIAFVSCTDRNCAVGILLGHGDGTFQPQHDYDQTAAIGGLAVGGLKGDGMLDIAVANYANGTVDVLLGNGDGTFQPPLTSAVPDPSSIAAADLNGDGLLDLVVSNWNANTVTVLLGNGDGTFQPAQLYATGANPGSVNLADLRGVGKLDIVHLSENNAVNVLLGNGDGTFQPATTVYAPASPANLECLSVADLNGDGVPDLVITDQAANAIDVLPGNGDGAFQSPSLYPTGAAPVGLALADLNHDGRPDLAVASQAGNFTSILLNQAARTVILTNAYVPGSGTQSVSAAYSGDSNFAASVSNPLELAAGLVTPSMTLAALPADTVPWGQSLSLTIAVAAPSSLLPAPTGTASYSIDKGAVVKAALSAGSVTIPISQLSIGAHSISVTYGGDKDYAALPAQNLTLTVTQATPSIKWNPPAAITYGAALNTTQLNATSPVAGAFTYTPAYGTVLKAGLQTLSVTFTPTNKTDYAKATATVPLTVNQATPAISWTAPAAITYGNALNGAQLKASSKVAGTFVYSPAAGIILIAGPQTLSVTFTPTDTTDYTSATATVQLTVNQATPAIAWSTPKAIPYGTALGATQLNATSKVAGSFAYSPVAGTVLTIGSQSLSVTFTPADTADYTTSAASVSLTVNVATPAITWPTPAAIPYGTALAAAQLDASSPVAGTFAYTPAAGTILTVGSQSLSVTFTPADNIDYNSATASVKLTVSVAKPPIVWATPAPIAYGTALSAIQLNATSPVAGTFVYSPLAGTVLSAGSHTLCVTFTPSDTADYSKATSTVTQLVGPNVLAQPSSLTVVSGHAATFSVAVTGTPALTYQWQYLSGTTWKPFGAGTGLATARLTTVPTTSAFSGLQLRVQVTDANGLWTVSNPATLTVSPAIITPPASQTVPYGSPATFTVAADGVAPLTYDWQYQSGATWKDFGAGTGYNTATLTTAPTTAVFNLLQFRVRVTDANGFTVTSNQVKLMVGPAFTTQPVSQTVSDGATATFAVTVVSVSGVAYLWQFWNGTAWQQFGPATGYNTTTLTARSINAANNGMQVRVVVTDPDGLTAISDTAIITVAPTITTQPTHQTEPVGWCANFTVAAIGVPDLTYQWQYLSGTTWKPFGAGTGYNTATLTTVNTTLAFNGLQFRVVITDGNGLTVTSKAVTLTVIL